MGPVEVAELALEIHLKQASAFERFQMVRDFRWWHGGQGLQNLEAKSPNSNPAAAFRELSRRVLLGSSRVRSRLGACDTCFMTWHT